MKDIFDVRIYTPSDLTKTWYVYVVKNGQIVYKASKGLSKLTTFEDRMLQCLKIKSFLESEIRAGETFEKTNLPSVDGRQYNIIDAYELAMERMKKLTTARTTVAQYSTHKKQMFEAIYELKFHKENIKDFEPYHISLILEKCMEINKGSNDSYNKNLKVCKRVFRELVEAFIIPYNPASGLKDKTHTPEEKRLLTDKEYEDINKFFDKNYPNYLTFLKCQELGIRPNEVRQLKFSMMKSIEYKNKEFWFFDLPKEITKTDKSRLVPITKELMKRLPKKSDYPEHYYIFGGVGKTQTITFKPTEYMMGHNTSARFWKRHIKDGMGIDSNQYWLKSRNANVMRDKGIDLEIIKDLFGHSKESITKIYATKDYEIRMREVAEKLSEL